MESEKKFLEGYNIESYDRPSVTTDVVIYTIRQDDSDSFRKDPEKRLSVLLIERAEHPFKNKWALPGGFVRMDETVPDAAIRESASALLAVVARIAPASSRKLSLRVSPNTP